MIVTAKPLTAHANIAILGAGAIGQLMYHKLCLTGQAVQAEQFNDVVLIGRQPITQQHKLQFTDHSGQTHHTTATILSSDDTHLANINLLIVCVKAYQVENALLPLLSKLAPNCHVVLLHNGLGPHLAVSEALEHYPALGLSLGTTSQAALKISQWHIKHTGFGVTQLGHYCGTPLSTELKHRLQALHRDNQPLEWYQPVLPILWQKLAINAVINPLSALNKCANGQLAAEEYQPQITAIIDELVDVAKCDGIELDPAQLLNRVKQVIALTSANFSSMYQDVTHHRVTEIDYINGYICQQARRYNLAVPTNQSLVVKVAALSQY
ncbi:ketopantoate reductase family protein [Shewanella saliphila]|uniref:2-dehydropantoate 2-reductase n=1 Tax=Shewanella saliphila TaxID=2282698 RepID=A0ABQ2Q5C6_9GAMM|nr:2-dehydropantoate 2-reductase [Shewanella saliphila]MCL1101954.1 2-dehydropantoate 2-reductase [Shewanella saliphila]GGP52740.1 2-dehydropantoate 2-reductase [Shewanella saliphila]